MGERAGGGEPDRELGIAGELAGERERGRLADGADREVGSAGPDRPFGGSRGALVSLRLDMATYFRRAAATSTEAQ